MKTMLAFITIMLTTFTTKAQSTITYYDQYGLEKGRAKITHDSPPQPTFKGDYYESGQPNASLIYSAMAQRQKLYDERKTRLIEKYNGIIRLFQSVLVHYPHLQEKYITPITNFATKMNTGKYDLSLDQVTFHSLMR